MFWLLIYVLAGLCSWAGTQFYRHWAIKVGILDHPTDRGSHSVATPRGGGVVFVLVILVFAAALALSGYIEGRVLTLVLACSLVALVGFLDDWKSLSSSNRLLVHFIVVAILIGVGMAGISWSLWIFVLMLVALFFGAWMINLYNFMDGSDGIAATQAIFVSCIVAGTLWLHGLPEVSAIAAISAAAIAGFVAFNLPPARLFMGDVGSGFLGALVASYAVLLAPLGWHGVLILICATALFVVDASLTLAIRVLRGHGPTEPHRSHIYQRLVRAFGSHAKTLLCYAAVNMVLVLPICLWQMQAPGVQWGGAIALYGVLSALYFLLAVRVPA